MKFQFCRIIILLFTFNAINLLALEAIPLPEKLTSLSIEENIEFIEDQTNLLELNQVLQINQNWQKKTKLHFGFTNSTIWLRFSVQNLSLNKTKFIFDTKNSRLDFVEFYFPEKTGSYKSILTGDTFSYFKRDVTHPNFAFFIELNPLETKVYYCKLKSSNNVLNLDPSILSISYFEKNTKDQILLNGIFYGFMIIMLLYNFSLFFSVKEKSYLYFSIYVFFQLFYFLGADGTGFQYLYPNFPWLQNRISSFSTLLALIFSIFFINTFLDLKSNLPKALKVNGWMIILLFILLLLNPIFLMESFPKIAFYITNFFIFLCLGFAFFYSSYLARKKFRPAYFYLTAWLLFLFTALLRVLAVVSIIPSNFITMNLIQIGIPLNLVLISLGLADRINHFKNKLQESNERLEDKVEKRTFLLKESLREVTKLKEKQDGDYYLTSLLIKPLAVNKVKKENIEIEFFIKQKKEFQFRERDKLSIGGDICIAHSISLRDRDYTVFLNADAMGKSLQGASGALIIGSLFGSIVNRLKISKEQQGLSPERWMKNAFIEMHKIFEVFDFSMMVSIAFGMIEEDTGLLYYINADHPLTILLRSGDVRFIERNPMFPKLGMRGLNNIFYIQTFQLQKGDVLIAGSDGREDIMDPATGDIQWDENFFLKHVKLSQGDLEKIFNSISALGVVIDDLSLLKIIFKGNIIPFSEILSPIIQKLLEEAENEIRQKKYDFALNYLREALLLEMNHPQILKRVAFTYFRKKDFENALQFALTCLEVTPDDISLLYFASKSLTRLERYEEAMDFSERIRLRNPFLRSNLLHLYRLNMLTRNFTRAQKRLNQYKEILGNSSSQKRT